MIFKTAQDLVERIDDFLDCISQAGLVFKTGLKNFLEKDMVSYQQRLITIKDLESKADDLRRGIENDLYRHSLIPQHRGDVLDILDCMDEVIDILKETLFQLEIENPHIPEDFIKKFMELSDMACEAVEAVTISARVFFREPYSIKNHIHKVYFYEKEADVISLDLKRSIFSCDKLDLSQKMHLRYFTLHIDEIADNSELVADKLSIYAIKMVL